VLSNLKRSRGWRRDSGSVNISIDLDPYPGVQFFNYDSVSVSFLVLCVAIKMNMLWSDLESLHGSLIACGHYTWSNIGSASSTVGYLVKSF
jgi:hypothetical protein